MKSDIKVPAMGESISEAVIGHIIAPTGTAVRADAEVLELETDKVNQVLYAPQAGKVSLFVKPGEAVKIGQVIGVIEESDQKIEESPPIPKEVTADKANASKESAQHLPQKTTPPVPPTLSSDAPREKERTSMRQTKEAFLADLKSSQDSDQNQAMASSQKSVSDKKEARQETRSPMSKIRRVIANRLVQSKQTTAMLTTFNEVDMSQIIQLREKFQENFIKKYGTKLGFMSFFVKATVSALTHFPQVNSYIDGEDIVQRKYCDIGVAVGTDRGTLVPIIRNCDQLSFAQIELAIDECAKKAREGRIAIDDLQGGGFTITNGGIYGSLLSTPILNPSQCGILGMHKIEKRPVVIEDQIVIRSMMYLALSYDHRLIDGKESVSFLVHIKNLLEDPSRLLLDI